MTTSQNRWLTPREIAEHTGIHVRLIRSWIERGLLPTYRPGSSRHLVRLADLEAFLAASRTDATAGPLADAKATR